MPAYDSAACKGSHAATHKFKILFSHELFVFVIV